MKKRCKSNRNGLKSINLKSVAKCFILIVMLFLSNPDSSAQKVTISLNDTTAEAVINEIREKAKVNIVYNHEEVGSCAHVTVNVKDASIESVLKLCFKDCDVEFKKIDNSFIIVPKKETSKNIVPQPNVLRQNIRGKVIDRDSKMTIPFANVIVLNTNPMIGTTTDENGDFKIEDLPVGRYTLKVTFVGYEEAVLSELLLGSGKELIVNIPIAEKISSLNEVKVTAKKGQPLNEMASVSARSFSVEETKRYAASISDPARMALSFAGVSTGDDVGNEIIIRGNSPNWMLWRLEGVEIPSPNHFAEEGYTSGAVSILSSNMIGKSDFYTGAFPAEYGNALSGVFDIKLRNGNNEKSERTIQVGLLGVDLSAEGPFSNNYRGSYLFNYRYSTFSIMNDLGITLADNALPEYQDFSFKFHLPTKKAGTFSIWGLGGLSDIDERFSPDTLFDEKITDGYSDFTETGMYAAGISHTFFPDQKSYIKTVVSHSLSFSGETYKENDSLGVLLDVYNDDMKKQALRINSFYNRKVSKRWTTRLGATADVIEFKYKSNVIDSSDVLQNFMDGKGQTMLYGAYFQNRFRFTDNLALTAGLHYSYFELSNDQSIEPRLGLTIQLPKQQKLNFGYGRHTKPENLPVYFVKREVNGETQYPNKGLKMTRSDHYIASYEKLFSQSVLLKTEAYYQQISDLAVPDNPNKYIAPMFGNLSPYDTLANIGEGRNYGLELTLQKFFTNDYYFMVTSSLFQSEYKPADGKWRSTKYNINYINNIVGGKEIQLKNNRMLSFNAKMIWSGGKRQIPIDLEKSIDDGEVSYVMEKIFSEKAKDYFRLDVGAHFHIYKKRSEHVISVDIQNVSNRWNVWTVEYNPNREELYEYPMAGLIPIVNYRIEF